MLGVCAVDVEQCNALVTMHFGSLIFVCDGVSFGLCTNLLDAVDTPTDALRTCLGSVVYGEPLSVRRLAGRP